MPWRLILFKVENLPGEGFDLALIFVLPGAEFQLVGEAAVVLVQLALFPADLILGEPGALQYPAAAG